MATGSRPVYAIQPVLRPPPIYHRLTQALAAPHEKVLPCLVSLDAKHPASGRRRQCVRLAAAGSSSFTSSRQEQNEKAFSDSGAHKTTENIKAELYLSLESKNILCREQKCCHILVFVDADGIGGSMVEGTDRGVFGITSAKKSEIKAQVEALESRNPTPNPTDHLLYKVDGCWKLIYCTVTILGSKRTKLGLRDFISLGDLYQTIDVAKERAVNVINFNAKGLKILTGQLTIEASYKIASKTRVNIKLENSSITPDQLMNLFQKNYDLLIEIFNPEGWLDITYVDESMRIGRDAKGNIFVLERAEQEDI